MRIDSCHARFIDTGFDDWFTAEGGHASDAKENTPEAPRTELDPGWQPL